LLHSPQAEYAKALARYKAATFTDTLSEAELAAAQKSFERGMTLFKRGALREALVIFDEVCFCCCCCCHGGEFFFSTAVVY
jgi:hypothetical protein